MDKIGVKNEFSGKNEFFSSISFCQACLSTDRALSPVSKYVDILHKICELQCTILRINNAHLCWECMSLINKVKLFVEKVADSQKLLETFVENKQGPFPHSLSRLTSSQAITDQITIIYEEKEIKPIKQERDLDDYFESIDNFDYCSDVKDEPDFKPAQKDIDKIENVAETSANTDNKSYRKSKEFNLKRNAKRQAKYRFVNSKIKKHRSDMVRNVVIDENDLLSSLEVERKNLLFVKAEFKCVGCVEILDKEEGLVRHNEKYHDLSLGSFVCHICDARFPSSAALSAHGAAHRVRRVCRVCGHCCCAARGMLRHLRNHDRMVQCLACGLFYKNVRLFYDHYKALHSRFVCAECGKRCKSRDIIIKHLRYHFGYVCPFCKKKLKNSSSYNNHVECQHSASRADDAYCVQCDRRFKNDKLYKRHLQASSAHAMERDNRVRRKYPCPECSNVYSRRTYMNNHYRHVHAKQSKHYCQECDRHFLNRTRFTDHRRFKHEGARRDKDKLCNICGRGFAANRTLINHIRTHSGERPFACEHCGAKFTQKHAMMSHVKYIHLKSRRKPSWHE